MLILKAQQSPWTLGRSMENIWSWQLEKMYYPLCMKTFGNGRKALQKKCQVVTIVHLHIWKNDQQGVNKVSTRCQQGVRFVIISRWKICKSSYLSFVCRQKIIFVFVFAFVICFLEGGTRSKKKWYFGKMEGGEKTKCGFNKRSITS